MDDNKKRGMLIAHRAMFPSNWGSLPDNVRDAAELRPSTAVSRFDEDTIYVVAPVAKFVRDPKTGEWIQER